MTSEFSLIDALDKLYLDPFPTNKFRTIVKFVKNVAIILEEIHSVKMCCIGDIVAKLTFTPADEAPDDKKNRFVPTAEMYKCLKQKRVPERFASVLVKLLLYIVVKLNRCCGEDASSILYDFDELFHCVFVYRQYSIWDNSGIDGVVALFLKKLIRMVKEMTPDNRSEKFHLFNVVRIMIMEFAAHPAYSGSVIEQLGEEIRIYYRHVEELAATVDSYTHENYLTYLFILNEIIPKILTHKNKKEAEAILSNLHKILNDVIALNKMSPREAYLIQNIAGVIGVYLSA